MVSTTSKKISDSQLDFTEIPLLRVPSKQIVVVKNVSTQKPSVNNTHPLSLSLSWGLAAQPKIRAGTVAGSGNETKPSLMAKSQSRTSTIFSNRSLSKRASAGTVRVNHSGDSGDGLKFSLIQPDNNSMKRISSTDSPNVFKGGVEPKNVKSKTSLSRLESISNSFLQQKISDKLLAHRNKLLKAYNLDFDLSSFENPKGLDPEQNEPVSHPLVENGKKVLKKTQRTACNSFKSEETKMLPLKPFILKPTTTTNNNASLIESTLQILSDNFSRNSLERRKTAPTSAIPSDSVSKTFNYLEHSESWTNNYVKSSMSSASISRKKPQSDLSRIQLSAAAIKHVMDDPLVIKEEGILAQIANPRNEINKKTLAKLLGESEKTSMHTLKARIMKKANRSRSLVPPESSHVWKY